MSLPDRITSRVRAVDNGCWEWTGSLSYGYGQTTLNGRKVKVHRIYFIDLVGPIPEGLDLDHLCRNRACCNPAHLEPVTRSENIARSPVVRFNNGRARQAECKSGHAFTRQNTYIRPDGTRTCRACNRLSAARTQRRRLDRMIAVTPESLTNAS